MKSKLKKIIIRVLIVLVSVAMLPFLAFGTLLLVVPISRSDEAVRNYVLRQIPTGTSWEDTIETIEEREWGIIETSTECGLLIYVSGYTCFATDWSVDFSQSKAQSESRVIGVKAMFVELGEYYGPFYTAVFAYMAFDENNELIEVTIRRDIDSL